MLKNAEQFHLECISTRELLSRGITTFDSMRHYNFHNEERKYFNIEKLPCTSESIKLHIKRTFLQTHKWINAATTESISLSSLNYGYEFETDSGTLIPQVTPEERTPADFPQPCTCLKCSRVNICLCRMKGIPCCDFCKCSGSCKYTKDISSIIKLTFIHLMICNMYGLWSFIM